MWKRYFLPASSVEDREPPQTAQLFDLLVNTPVALEKWSLIAARIVKDPAERQEVAALIEHDGATVAIRRTLELWVGYASKKRPNLLRVLRKLKVDPIGAHIDSADHEDLVRLRDTFVNDVGALTKWGCVIDRILAREPAADRLRIKQHLREERYEEAVLQTLLHWRSSGANRVEFKGALELYNIDPLPAEIARAGGDHNRPVGDRLTSTPPARKWIIVTAVLSTAILSGFAILAVPLYNIMLKSRTEPVPAEAGRGLAPSEGAGGVWFEVDDVPPSFTGRQKELEYLNKTLGHPGSHGNIISIFGTGGVGKSSLVRKFAIDNRDAYDGNVVWINGETHASVRASYLRLAENLGFRLPDDVSDDELAGKIFGYFFNRRCLFIFDNVPEEPLGPTLRQLQLKIVNLDGQMHDVITISRSDRGVPLSPAVTGELGLQPLTELDATTLIQSQLPNATKANAVELAEKLHRLPLLVQQAVALLICESQDRGADAIRKYLDGITQSSQPNRQSAGAHQSRMDSINSMIFATTSEAMNRMQELEDRKGRTRPLTTILNILAYLNPDMITTQLLPKIVDPIFLREAALIEAPSLKTLERFSMVKVTKGKVVLHSLIGDVVRARLTYDEEADVLVQIIMALDRLLENNEHSDLTREATSHGLHLLPFYRKHPLLMTTWWVYEYNLCRYLLHYGYYMETRMISEQIWSTYKIINVADDASALYMRPRFAQSQTKLNHNSKAT